MKTKNISVLKVSYRPITGTLLLWPEKEGKPLDGDDDCHERILFSDDFSVSIHTAEDGNKWFAGASVIASHQHPEWTAFLSGYLPDALIARLVGFIQNAEQLPASDWENTIIQESVKVTYLVPDEMLIQA